MIQRKKKKDNPSEFASESMFKTCIDVLASTHGIKFFPEKPTTTKQDRLHKQKKYQTKQSIRINKSSPRGR
jgi:hypothetical protein